MNLKKVALIVIPAIALTLGASGGARADLVTNGGFENVTAIASPPAPVIDGTNGQLGYNINVNNWTGFGYTFVYGAGTAFTEGGNGISGLVKLDSATSASSMTGTTGGNFIASDPVYDNPSGVDQAVSVTAGVTYAVSFLFAGTQQSGFLGTTTEGWNVNLTSGSAGSGTAESNTASTATLTTPQQGFIPWQSATLYITANVTGTEYLTFTSFGSGAPPFVLLDNVSMNATPEPSTLLQIGSGLLGVGIVWLRRRAMTAVV